MLLYDGGRAPNPRRVRIFLAEKGVDVPRKAIDMGALGHRSEEVTSLNPLQRLPVLELDDGAVLTESVAICRYFEELHPDPPLMGVDAKDKAVVEMWNRRAELNFLLTVANAFRHTHQAMEGWEVPQIQEYGEASREKAREFMEFLDQELANRPFIAGERFSIADITAMMAMDMLKPARIDRPIDLKNLIRWYESVSSRPSASA
ncbi:glutathione S-transferase [Hoeflea sp. WL0058]|uniref:Glutathione S-transferase n=1 Tax=Flavimaribacter sediminis TaxID=2865987 RepID=A0AAE2ZHH6_9HYPH|nr:glutathione S-transferase [Flavimaribacter sediminis]MBW8636401.1 glutathione S-transferase [Flavimaribacter sediminis]